MAEKSVVVTYVLWMTCGWFGVHHLYLRRYRHAFVWLWTCGGCFGLGWLLEFWRLSDYVDIANNNTKGHRLRDGVGFRWKRFTGELVLSMLLGVLSVSAVPKSIMTGCPLLAALATLFIAAGL